jgi:hypothetical protein
MREEEPTTVNHWGLIFGEKLWYMWRDRGKFILPLANIPCLSFLPRTLGTLASSLLQVHIPQVFRIIQG